MSMRNWMFRQWWRLSKAREIISLFFWIATFVGIWAPIIQDLYGGRKHIIMPLIGGVSLIFAFIFGYLWDKMGLWREQSHQNLIRSEQWNRPYGKEAKYYVPLQLEIAKTLLRKEKNPELEKKVKETEEWLKKHS